MIVDCFPVVLLANTCKYQIVGTEFDIKCLWLYSDLLNELQVMKNIEDMKDKLCSCIINVIYRMKIT